MQVAHITAVAVAAAIVLVLIILFLWRCCCSRNRRRDFVVDTAVERAESLQAGIAKLHHRPPSLDFYPPDARRRSRPNFYAHRRVASGKSPPGLFNWADYPSLVTDAVENGWAQFAFRRAQLSSPSTARSMLLGGLCAAAADFHGRDSAVDIGWEPCPGPGDFLQKVRLNVGVSTMAGPGNPPAAASVIRTGLPLPGPMLASSSFPQEAYFEITVVCCGNGEEGIDSNKRSSGGEGERTKLIQENQSVKMAVASESLVHVGSAGGNRSSLVEESRVGEEGGGGGAGDAVALSLGLTAGGSLPSRLPGSYPVSIGFNSDGSVYLDGVKLAFESQMAEWGQTNTVIGCGYNPSQKKVFFTVNSELVRVIHCKSEAFGTPLFPTLAANADITVLVNFGQCSFRYAPANAQRTANPCFTSSFLNSHSRGAALVYDDSRELFSMGRIDSQWLNRSTTAKGSRNNGSKLNNHRIHGDFDQESESDLFEIVLDNHEQSSNTRL